MSDLFAEVDEIMRQERLKAIWDQYGNMIITAIAAIIILTAAHSGYKAWDTHAKESQTSAMNALLEDESFPTNLTADNKTLKGDVKAIAMIEAARLYLEQETPDNKAALDLYKAISEDKKVSSRYADLATLMTARLTLENDKEAAKALLQAAIDDNDNLWRHHAAIDLAVIEADAENYTKAIELLDTILNTDAIPTSLLSRADSLRHVYELKNTDSAQ